MASMRIDAVSVASSDLAASVRFYGLLGFAFAPVTSDSKHLEAITPPGEARLMVDDAALIKSITGKEPRPSTHSSFAIKCESPAQVDAACERVRAAGFAIIKEPWDAFWGQRYAIVADPAGYMCDLFAPL
jgi:uncharacterized glyoxalase superfamily protein PhnB